MAIDRNSFFIQVLLYISIIYSNCVVTVWGLLIMSVSVAQ